LFIGSVPVGFEESPDGSSWLEGLRSRLMDGLATSRTKNVRGNGDSPQRDFGELVRLLVVPAGHVVKLYAIELFLKSLHGIAVCLYLVVMTARVLHDLVDHELRVSPNVEALDARLDGDSEVAEEGLVLRHVV
jgi:hypothetical protein